MEKYVDLPRLATDIQGQYEMALTLRPQCRKACLVTKIVSEVVHKGCVAHESVLKALSRMEEIVRMCKTHPVRAKLLSESLVDSLKSCTEHIRDCLAEALCPHDADIADAREELDEIAIALESYKISDDFFRILRCGDGDALVARFVKDGVARDARDAVTQLDELQRSGTNLSDFEEERCHEVLQAVRSMSLARHFSVASTRKRKSKENLRRAGDDGGYDSSSTMEETPTTTTARDAAIGSCPPTDFTCPITLEIMEDPVFLFTQAGRSFERAALEKWLALHPTVDPLTNETYATLLEFAPNRVLRDVIESWRKENSYPPAKRVNSPRESAPKCIVRPALGASHSRMNSRLETLSRDFPLAGPLVHRLSPDFAESDREDAARRLLHLCETNDTEEAAAVSLEIRLAGGVPALAAAISSSSSSSSFEEAAVLALWKLSRRPRENRVVIANARAIPPLVRVLSSRDATYLAKQAAAGILQNLSCYSSNYKVAVANAGAIPPLVQLISLRSEPTSSVDYMEGVREDAARCLWSIAVSEQKKIAIAKAGAIPSLVRLVAEGTNDGVREAGAGALQNLAANNTENKTAIVAAGGIAPLVRLVADGATDGAKEAAAGALQNLAKHDENNKAAIVRAGAIPHLAAVVRDSCRSDKAKRTSARALENLAWNNDTNKVAIANSGAVQGLASVLQRSDAPVDVREAAAEALKVLTNSKHARIKVAKALGWRFVFTPSQTDVDDLITSCVRRRPIAR